MKKRLIFIILPILLVMALVTTPVLAQDPKPPQQGLLWEGMGTIVSDDEGPYRWESNGHYYEVFFLGPGVEIRRTDAANQVNTISFPVVGGDPETWSVPFNQIFRWEVNGHYYFVYYGLPIYRPESAYAAGLLNVNGVQGYLVAINTPQEQALINSARMAKGDAVGLWIGLIRNDATDPWWWDNLDPYIPPGFFWGDEGTEQTTEHFASMETWNDGGIYNYDGWWMSSGNGIREEKPMYAVEILDSPPTADAGQDQSVMVGTPVSLDGGDSSDPDDDYPLTFSWEISATPDGSTVALDEPSSVTPGFMPDMPGTYVITLVVDDSYGDSSDPDQVTVEAFSPEANEPPIADAGGLYEVDEGSTLILDGSGSFDPDEPDDSIVSYEWDLDDDGEYDDGTGETISLDALDDSTFTAGLKVTDSHEEFSTATTTVTINNVAPTANAGDPKTVDEGETVAFSGSFTDPGTADTHTITWDFGDGSPPVSGTITPSHVYDDDGVYTAELTVTDDDGGVGSNTVMVTVDDLGPTAALTGDTELDEGSTGNYNASGSTSSPDEIISYEWDWDYDEITFIPSGDTDDVKIHAWSNDGTYIVAVRVTDDDGSTDIAILYVTVENPPPAVMVETLRDAVEDMGLPHGIENSLTSSLDTAMKVLKDSNPKNDVAATNALQAFINKVEAQRGKKISETDANTLIAIAQEIITELGRGT